MATPAQFPHAVFTGSLGDRSTGTWAPAEVVASGGSVTLFVSTPAGWEQLFSVPAEQVKVTSAAQRITLHVGGRRYPILADPGAVRRVYRLQYMGGALGLSNALTHQDPVHRTYHRLGHRALGNTARGLNQAAAARAFSAQGGKEFLAASRASGARVSRLGYGPLLAIGCGLGALVPLIVLVVAAALLSV